jgi:VWFA-related protein
VNDSVNRHSRLFRRSAGSRACLTAPLLLAVLIYAQLPPPPPGPVPPPTQNTTPRRATFSLTMSQVIVNVSVSDRAGKPIENLTKDDFEIYEDGKRQTIRACQFERLAKSPLPPLGQPLALPERSPVPQQVPVAAPPGILEGGISRFQDRRLVVMLFDLSSMAAAEQIRAQHAAIEFLSKQMTASDMVSIMVFGSELKTLQDFTADRELLISVVRNFHIGESSELASMSDTGPDSQDQSGMFTPDETEFNIFNTDRKLAALEDAARRLSQYPEKKALVFLSGGVEKTGVDNQSQLQATVNAAVRANVAFFPIDARGLVAQVPGGDATQAGPSGNNLYTGAGQRSLKDSFQDSQETLYSLSADTGGKALLDSNDLTEGIRAVQEKMSSYYLLAYESTNPAADGKYRRIQVKLAPRLANLRASLDFRKGYFAPVTFAKSTASDKENQLQQAMDSESPITDLPLAVEVDYFRLEKNKYFVPITVRIPGSALAFKAKKSKQATALDFIAEVRDSKDRAADSVRDSIPLKIDEDTAAAVSRKQVQYDTGLTLPPGKYSLRFVARENGEGKVGTFQTPFLVPDLDTSKTLRLSSLVVSNQIQDAGQQIGGVKNNKKLSNQNPLLEENGRLMVPNVTRVFRPGQNFYALLEIYDPAAPENMPSPVKLASVSSTLALYSDRSQKVFETKPMQLRRSNTKRDSTMALRFQTTLAGLKPGRYTCQVNVIDEFGRKFAFPRVPFVIAELNPNSSSPKTSSGS